MTIGIEIAWWIGLLGALIPMVVILKQVAVILRALEDIHTLACSARDAARQIGRNVAASGALASSAEPAVLVREASGNINTLAGLLEQTLQALAKKSG